VRCLMNSNKRRVVTQVVAILTILKFWSRAKTDPEGSMSIAGRRALSNRLVRRLTIVTLCLGLIGATLFVGSISEQLISFPTTVQYQFVASGQVPKGLTADTWRAIQASIERDKYRFNWDEATNVYHASNALQGMNIALSSQGFAVSPREEAGASWKWGLQLQRYGYADALQAAAPVSSTKLSEQNKIEYARGNLIEWYVNDPRGLEQGFTILQRPDTATSRGAIRDSPLQVVMSLRGNLQPRQNGDAIILANEQGRKILSYSKLVAYDALGQSLPTQIWAAKGEVILQVADSGASYPVVIDPTIEIAKLTAGDGAANDIFGRSVAISGDTIVVGAQSDDIGSNSNQGSAYVYVKPVGGWATTSTFTAKLTASDGSANDEFGTSAAIGGDTIVVGAQYDSVGSNNNQGSAYVYVKPGGGWATTSTFTAKLTASDGSANDRFGISAAIGGDTIVVGAQYDSVGSNSNQGSAYVYVKPEGGWATTSTFTAKLTASDGAANDEFSKVGISGDTIVVGAIWHDIGSNSNQGSAYVYVKPGGGWATTSTFTAKLTASDGAANDEFGISVGISGDTIVVGAYRDSIGANGNQGSAYVFSLARAP